MTSLRAALAVLLITCRALDVKAQGKIDLARVGGSEWKKVNRTVVVGNDDRRQIARVSEAAGGGVIWNPSLQLTDGDIEVDVRGRNELQRSFIGVAFHVATGDSLEVVWLRPFNFASPDGERRKHSVQYASYPRYTWQRLRAESPGMFEAPVPPAIKPEDWIHLHVELRGARVRVFLNRDSVPVLVLSTPGGLRSGGVGLWVGDQSPGEFANLSVRRLVRPAGDRYGFVTVLGRDTIAVERVVRSAGRLVSDQVDRFPRVVQRHTEIQFRPDGRIGKFTMDLTLPTAVTPKWRQRHVTGSFDAKSVRVTIRNGEGERAISLPTDGRAVVPWSSQLYSMFEEYARLAPTAIGDSSGVLLLFPDAQIEETRVGHGFVRRKAIDRVEFLRHDMLAGTGEAIMDSRGRMRSYSGARTTFKNEVTRVAESPDVEGIGQRFVELERKAGDIPPLSVRDTARGHAGSAELVVDYGRPLARGRKLLGEVIPFFEIWRTGANAATQLFVSQDVRIGSLDVPEGKYSLWTYPTPDGIDLIVNRQYGQWGTQYDAQRDLGRVRMRIDSTASISEQFTISIEQGSGSQSSIVLQWGRFRWTAPVERRIAP